MPYVLRESDMIINALEDEVRVKEVDATQMDTWAAGCGNEEHEFFRDRDCDESLT